MGRDEFVVSQMRIGAADAIDLFTLAGAKIFLGVEAPNAFKQALPSQQFVNTRDAADVAIRGIEESGIAIGDLDRAPEQLRRDRHVAGCEATALRMKLHGLLRPDGPMPKQPSDDPAFDWLA